jgi:Fungal N-terminal domain of STAND proteins
MAEAIGLASGVLTLALFAFQSSVSLRQVVDSFQSNKKIIRELKEELEALNGVLEFLQQAAAANSEDLSGLNLPLFRCGKACKDFKEVIIKCTNHSGGSRTSFRDWAKLQYMGDDITGFKDMLAGYKSTINIALADANLYVLKSNLLWLS